MEEGCSASQERGIDQRGFLESSRAEQTAVAPSTRTACWPRIVATVGEAVVQPERGSGADYLRLRHVEQRRQNAQLGAFHASPGGQGRQTLERSQVLRTAIGVSRVVERV